MYVAGRDRGGKPRSGQRRRGLADALSRGRVATQARLNHAAEAIPPVDVAAGTANAKGAGPTGLFERTNAIAIGRALATAGEDIHLTVAVIVATITALTVRAEG